MENLSDNKLYWLWLTLKRRIRPAKITALLDFFDNIEEIYGAESYDGILGADKKLIRELMDKDLSHAKRVINQCAKLGAGIITYDSEKFPPMLKNIIDPPYVLYIKGEIPDWNNIICIGVVGTRIISDYGVDATRIITSNLVKYGVTVVTGLAVGADAEAARAALNANEKVIGVIGSGIDVIYPPENEDLFHRVMDNGLLMTEYPPGSGADRHHFPERNRIIAGLSKGVVVTEAPAKSGALITANYAIENGRDVYAVPSDITHKSHVGCHRLIQQGAKLVQCAEDIIIEYEYDFRRIFMDNGTKTKGKNHAGKSVRINGEKKYSETVNKEEENIKETGEKYSPKVILKEEYPDLNEDEFSVLKKLSGGKTHIDDISRDLSIPMYRLGTMLVLLEMQGLVEKLPGGNYILKE